MSYLLSAAILNLFSWANIVILFEGSFTLMICWILISQLFNANNVIPRKGAICDLDRKEALAKVAKWNPSPMVDDFEYSYQRVLQKKINKYAEIDGNKYINFANHDYLGMSNRANVERSAINAIHKYGIGSCGPRLFYGSMDVHLDLEAYVARFMRTEAAVIYSYGFSTISSALAAYIKKKDIVFADEKVTFAIQKGLEITKCNVVYFKHNDVADLRYHMSQHLNATHNKGSLKSRNVFVVVEGIFLKTGHIVPLRDILDIRSEYKFRVFMDESVSFGILGRTGRGVTEHYDIDVTDVDMIMASMEYSLGTIGGFCVGSNFIIEHQRLAGSGYCFSASLPPLLASAAIAALSIAENEPKMILDLRKKCRLAHFELEKSLPRDFLALIGDDLSPIKHLVLVNAGERYCYEEQSRILGKIVSQMMNRGILLTTSEYLTTEEYGTQQASVRIAINVQVDEKDIIYLAKCVGDINIELISN